MPNKKRFVAQHMAYSDNSDESTNAAGYEKSDMKLTEVEQGYQSLFINFCLTL